MRKTEYFCDTCGEQIIDVNKNLLILSGAMIKFDQNGPKRVAVEQYFCSTCSFKLMEFIEKIHESAGITNSGTK